MIEDIFFIIVHSLSFPFLNDADTDADTNADANAITRQVKSSQVKSSQAKSSTS